MSRRAKELLVISTVGLGLLAVLILFVGAGPGYRRLDWKHWIDVSGTCQSVRTAVLIRDAVKDTIQLSKDGCRVEAGQWVDPYTGAKLHDPRQLNVDHLVPLKNAHESGGATWSPERRREYANFLGYRRHLITTFSSVNREKGAQGPDTWRPPDPGAACWYGTAWAAVKFSWDLRGTEGERAAVRALLATCGEETESGPTGR